MSQVPDYDGSRNLSLQGQGPLGEGLNLEIRLGESVLLGRSRHCDWSLKSTPTWLRSQDDERKRIRRSLGWRTTSRRHCRITYLAPDLVEVRSLSPNGTLVDTHRVDRIVLTDCREATHEIRLGVSGETLHLLNAGRNGGEST